MTFKLFTFFILCKIIIFSGFVFRKVNGFTSVSINGTLGIHNCQVDDLKHIRDYDTKELYISHCKISTLPNAIFLRFSQLTIVEITDSKLNIIQDFALNGLKSLKYLSFVKNNITEVKSWCNEDLIALHYLDLRRNFITNINSNSFKRFPNIQKLNLAINLIEHIPEGTFRTLTQLKYLNIGKNFLTKIFSYTFKGMIKLNHLSIHFNRIEDIDKNALITNIHIRSLRLEGNYLANLDALSTTGLSRLFHLNISYNKLESLGEKIFSRNFDLHDLDVSHNNIVEIEENSFIGLHSLKKLNVSNNNIKMIHSNSFQELDNLINLDLSSNNLTSIDDSILKYSPLIENLNISRNYIDEIDSYFFRNSIALKCIDLSFNRLHKDNFLSIPSSVKYLDISENLYNTLNVSLFYDFIHVNLAGNPWNCKWLIKEMIQAPESIQFGYNYTIESNDYLLTVPGIDCYDDNHWKSIVVLDNKRRDHIEDISKITTAHVSVDWPQLKINMDGFDQKSVIIWLIIAVAIVFTSVRMGRKWLQKSERKSEEIRRLQHEMMIKEVQDYLEIPRRNS